jgi:hypothetical protein
VWGWTLGTGPIPKARDKRSRPQGRQVPMCPRARTNPVKGPGRRPPHRRVDTIGRWLGDDEVRQSRRGVQVHSRAYRCLAAQRQVDLTTGKPLFWVCFNAMSCENAAKPGFFATAGTERRVFFPFMGESGQILAHRTFRAHLRRRRALSRRDLTSSRLRAPLQVQ